VGLSVTPQNIARQRLGKYIPTAAKSCSRSLSIWSVSLKESRRLVLPRTCCYLPVLTLRVGYVAVVLASTVKN
jgi:hypothetical protein